MNGQKSINSFGKSFYIEKNLSIEGSQNKNNSNNIKNNILFSKNSQRNIIINDLNDEELNTLKYEKALKIDNRTFFQYYWSLVKKKHIILFTFFPINDYNLVCIKICLFLVSLSLYFNVNALFFSDETMHKIYMDKGKFNFIIQIPKIIYSTIISAVISFIIKKLAVSEQNILDLKVINKENTKIEKEIKKTMVCLKIKFNLFFIISFIFLSIFWYYLSVFCAVYENTQLTLIKDVIFSFFTSLLYPFALNAMPAILRKIALITEGKSMLYKLSKIVALI